MTRHPFATILRSLSRPKQSSFRQQQCRSLKLMHATKATTVTGNLHLADIVGNDFYPPINDVQIDLWQSSHKRIGTLQLADALKTYGGPGKLLVPTVQAGGGLEGDRTRRYMFKQMKIDNPALKKQPRASKAGAKTFIFTPSTSLSPIKTGGFTFIETGRFEVCMLKAWGFLEHHQLAVEVQVHSKGSKGVSEQVFRKILENNVHLRPDVILAAMPQATEIIVKPQMDQRFRFSAWVMSAGSRGAGKDVLKPKDRTKWFREVQLRVGEHLKKVEGGEATLQERWKYPRMKACGAVMRGT